MTGAEPESSRDMWAKSPVRTADFPAPAGPQT
jgi:hypothetical protein